ncbi:MAG: ADP-ribosylglycohydrolase family protein [Planctomycetia bacterium]
MNETDLGDHLAGVLLGTAVGDALGLPCEGMTPAAIARRFGRMERYRLFGRTGFVSDDTEQAALVAQSLVRHPHDADRCAAAFRCSLFGWFLRLPFGVGLATIKACVRIGLGFRRSGVRSAGNGAAMRAAVVGVFFHDQSDQRAAFGRALAESTHTDPRAVEGALYVAELAAAVVASPAASPAKCQAAARQVVADPQLAAAIDRAAEMAVEGASTAQAAGVCGTSGFIIHTVPFATFLFLRFGDDPAPALSEAASAGGDADSIAAIVGAWLGARHGAAALPADLVARLHDGPFGPAHLRALAAALLRTRSSEEKVTVPHYSPTTACLRNLALIPVVLAHGFRRLIPL